MKYLLLSYGAAMLAGSQLLAVETAKPKPNVIVIYADDLEAGLLRSGCAAGWLQNHAIRQAGLGIHYYT